MVVDIGGGTTDIAVIALDGVVVSESIKVAGDKFDESIMKYVRSRYNLLIGERTAEEIKKTIGNVYRHSKVVEMTVGGRCLAQGIPREITLTSREMLEAMLNPIQAILDAICQVIERTPPELVQDITKNKACQALQGKRHDIRRKCREFHLFFRAEKQYHIRRGAEKSYQKRSLARRSRSHRRTGDRKNDRHLGSDLDL